MVKSHKDKKEGKSQGEKVRKHKRKRQKSQEPVEKLRLKLQLYAALGELRKVRKILDASPRADVSTIVNAAGSEGVTSLHQVGEAPAPGRALKPRRTKGNLNLCA